MSGNKDLRRAKHEAYQKKQAAKGEKSSKVDFHLFDSTGCSLCHLCSFDCIILLSHNKLLLHKMSKK